MDRSGIIVRLQDSQCIGITIIAIIWIIAILGKIVLIAVSVTIGIPVIGALGECFTPCEVVTKILRSESSYVAISP